MTVQYSTWSAVCLSDLFFLCTTKSTLANYRGRIKRVTARNGAEDALEPQGKEGSVVPEQLNKPAVMNVPFASESTVH